MLFYTLVHTHDVGSRPVFFELFSPCTGVILVVIISRASESMSEKLEVSALAGIGTADSA